MSIRHVEGIWCPGQQGGWLRCRAGGRRLLCRAGGAAYARQVVRQALITRRACQARLETGTNHFLVAARVEFCVEFRRRELRRLGDSILPERLLALVRPAFDLVLQRIRSLKRCVAKCPAAAFVSARRAPSKETLACFFGWMAGVSGDGAGPCSLRRCTAAAAHVALRGELERRHGDCHPQLLLPHQRAVGVCRASSMFRRPRSRGRVHARGLGRSNRRELRSHRCAYGTISGAARRPCLSSSRRRRPRCRRHFAARGRGRSSSPPTRLRNLLARK